MARSNVLSKPVTGWEVGYEDRAESPTFYSHRAGTAHIIAAINFDLLRLSSEKQERHALDSTAGLVALRAAARLRLTHVVRALGIARLVSVDIIDCSGGYAARPDSDPKLHRLPTEFPIGVYVQRSGLGHWGDRTKGKENGYQHPSHECPLHGQHDWIISSAWSSNGLQLVAIDRPYEREAIRFSLVSLIEQVYGTQIHSWTPSLPRPDFSIFDGFRDFDEQDYQKQAVVLSESARKAKEDEMNNDLMALQQAYQRYEGEFNQAYMGAMDTLLQKMRKIAEGIGQERGYTLVIEVTEGGVVYASSTVDITDELIKRYNAQNP